MGDKEISLMQEELTSLYATIQQIDAKMTDQNVTIMSACLGSIKYLLNLIENGGKDNGNNNPE